MACCCSGLRNLVASLGRSPLVRFALVLLPFAVNASADTPTLQGASQWNVVLVVSDALRAASLPPHHHDPFDRLLIAQAQSENLPIVTSDRAFHAYDVTIQEP